MTLQSVPILPLLNAVTAVLQDGTSRPFSMGDVYDLEDGDPYPYGVVQGYATARWGPGMVSGDLHADVVVQVDSVGRRPDQAIALADMVRAVILDRKDDGSFLTTIALPVGGTIGDREHVLGPTPPIKEGPDPRLVYTTSEQYNIRLLAPGA